MQRGERSACKGRFPEKWRKRASQVKKRLKMMLRQTVVLQRRTAKLFNDPSKALHKRIHIFRLCLIHPHYVRCCFMAPPSGLLHLVEHRCPAYTSHSKPSHNFLKTRTYTFALQTRGPLPSLPATPKQYVPVHLPRLSTVHPLLV